MNLSFNTKLAEGYSSNSQIVRVLTENWVKEFLSRVVEVHAESRNEAISKINVQYEKTEIVLDYYDFVEVNF